MAYADKRGGKRTGVWIAERTINGVKTRHRTSTKAAGDAWERHVDLFGSVPLDGTGTTIAHPIGAVAKEARANREGWKGSHDVSLDQRLEVVLAFFGPTSPLESVTKAKIYEFVRHLEARKGRDGGALSTKTINRYLAVVSAILDYARDCDYTKHAVSIPWQEEAEGRIEFLLKADEDAIAALLSDDERKVLKLLVLTGMRAGEFFALNERQVDTSDNRCAWVRLVGQDTKSGKGRGAPIHDADLARWLKEALRAGTLPTHAAFYNSFKAACDKLGLSSKLNVHSLRHTFGTRMAKIAKPAIVQTLMGHGSYKTTQKYIHLVDDDLIAATAALA
jgi:integrase